MAARRDRVLIIVQNLPVPLDRRVWLECLALVDAGYRVSVICPKGPGDRARQRISGVRIYKYRPPPVAQGFLGYALEFGYCWLRVALLSLVIFVENGFDVIQACNPPDTYWALGRLYKIAGKRFVYDQHDLNPEVFRSRFGDPTGLVARAQYRALVWLERRTYRTADHVIVTNESYRRVAMTRGGCQPSKVTVVRSGPDTSVMRPVVPRPELRHGRQNLLVYLGIMGPQDGVDIVLRVMDVLVNRQHRDVHAALLGFGDTYDELVALSHELHLDDHVTFTGRVGPTEVADYLSAADVGVSPDPFSPLNDVSTMNKTMEYMSFALPVVAFDLTETRVSAGDAAVYIEATPEVDAADIDRFASAVAQLLGDPDLCADKAVAGRRRAEQLLDWARQRSAYLSAYRQVTGHRDTAASATSYTHAVAPSDDTAYVPLDDDVLRAFVKAKRARRTRP